MGELARGMAAEPDLDATLTDITAAVIVAVSAAVYAGIICAGGRGRVVAQAPTDTVGDQLDQLQADLHQGPGVAALRQYRTVSIPEMAGEVRWPEFTAAAIRLGVGSMVSLRLFVEDETLGVLNLYATTSHGFTADDETTAEAFAAHAAVALRDAAERRQLNQAIASRDVIGQAKGILMARHRITAAQAFDLLVEASQETNRKLVDVARWLVDEQSPQDGSPAAGPEGDAAGTR
jgi:GAF domain-containing protein